MCKSISLPGLKFWLSIFTAPLHMPITSGSHKVCGWLGLFRVSAKQAHSFSQAHACCSHDLNLRPAQPLPSCLHTTESLDSSSHHSPPQIIWAPLHCGICCQSLWPVPSWKNLRTHGTGCWEAGGGMGVPLDQSTTVVPWSAGFQHKNASDCYMNLDIFQPQKWSLLT